MSPSRNYLAPEPPGNRKRKATEGKCVGGGGGEIGWEGGQKQMKKKKVEVGTTV